MSSWHYFSTLPPLKHQTIRSKIPLHGSLMNAPKARWQPAGCCMNEIVPSEPPEHMRSYCDNSEQPPNRWLLHLWTWRMAEGKLDWTLVRGCGIVGLWNNCWERKSCLFAGGFWLLGNWLVSWLINWLWSGFQYVHTTAELTKPGFSTPPLPPHQNVERAAFTFTYTVILPAIHIPPAQLQ
jgi:hypothetical protein